MILYSIIPMDIIFGSNDNGYENSLIEINYMGERLEVAPMSNSRYVINRIISTSPKAYLNPMLQPGTVIKSTI